jgi:uncharacterized protein (TIGR03083 family)
MDHLEHCDLLEVEIDNFANTLEVAPPETRVPSCPDWSVEELAQHLGTIHRWAEHLVRVGANAYESSDSMNLDHGPVGADWIRDGGSRLVATLRASDPDGAMWAWGHDQHVRFWSRRQLHETLIHRMDLDLTMGRVPETEPRIAVDGIDEFLVNLVSAAGFSPKVRELRGTGEVLHVVATDADAEWSIELLPDGFELTEDTSTPTASLRGPSTDLLLVLYRRLPLASTKVSGTGRRELIDFWIAHSALG